MNLTNPYSQAGWGSSNGSSPVPSIFGALPFSSTASGPSLHQFQFTSLNPDVLNCTVIGPQSKTYFRILDNTPSQDFTLFQNRDGKSVAVVEWRRAPGTVVEVRDIIRKQLVSAWLPLSADRKYRYMHALNRTFVWVPKNEVVGLYTYGTSTPELYARFFRAEGRVVLEVTSTAIQLGLLECCVVAVALLQSGRTID